jgi:RNA-directed DNA polymerase
VETKLSLITEIAVKDKKCKFTNLMHMLNIEGLKECFYLLKRDKASGIDNVTFEEYEKDLGTNLPNLVERMKRFSYRPQPVRRVYIPKLNGKQRPLGIPALARQASLMHLAR